MPHEKHYFQICYRVVCGRNGPVGVLIGRGGVNAFQDYFYLCQAEWHCFGEPAGEWESEVGGILCPGQQQARSGSVAQLGFVCIELARFKIDWLRSRGPLNP